VHLGPKLQGRAAVTDVHDVWVDNALRGLAEGTYVRARVLPPPPSAPAPASSPGGPGAAAAPPVALSLRPSHGGAVAGLAPAAKPSAQRPAAPEVAEPSTLAEGAVACGCASAFDQQFPTISHIILSLAFLDPF
jgi:rRNA biogenesis protein RRP5